MKSKPALSAPNLCQNSTSNSFPTALFREDLTDKGSEDFISSASRLLKLAITGKRVFIRDKVSIISNKKDAILSQKLLYNEYRRCDLCSENPSGLLFNASTLLPNCTSFISKNKDKLVGTIAVYKDSYLGLPSDSLYQSELDSLRKEGKRLVEVGSLALDSTRFKRRAHSLRSIKKFCSMSALFGSMLNWVYQFTDATHVVIMVNPKHTTIYDFIGFCRYAEERHYPLVNKPAVPLILDIEAFFNMAHYSLASLFALSVMRVQEEIAPVEYGFQDIAWRAVFAPGIFEQMRDLEIEALCEAHPSLKNILSRCEGDGTAETISVPVSEYEALIRGFGELNMDTVLPV